MNQRASFLIELLDKLGVPLMSAVQSGTADADGVAISPARDAELLAALLGQSVQLGSVGGGQAGFKGRTRATRMRCACPCRRWQGGWWGIHTASMGRLPGETETARMSPRA
jgi:hypothetical protein